MQQVSAACLFQPLLLLLLLLLLLPLMCICRSTGDVQSHEFNAQQHGPGTKVWFMANQLLH